MLSFHELVHDELENSETVLENFPLGPAACQQHQTLNHREPVGQQFNLESQHRTLENVTISFLDRVRSSFFHNFIVSKTIYNDRRTQQKYHISAGAQADLQINCTN